MDSLPSEPPEKLMEFIVLHKKRCVYHTYSRVCYIYYILLHTLYCIYTILLIVCPVVPDSATPWTAARQAPLSVGVSKQEYWSGLPCLPPGDLPNSGIEHRSPTFQADSLPSENVLLVKHDFYLCSTCHFSFFILGYVFLSNTLELILCMWLCPHKLLLTCPVLELSDHRVVCLVET